MAGVVETLIDAIKSIFTTQISEGGNTIRSIVGDLAAALVDLTSIVFGRGAK